MRLTFFLSFFIMVPFAGCNYCGTNQACRIDTRQITAARATSAVNIDGRLDEKVWKKAPGYKLELPKDALNSSGMPRETGSLQMAWDNNNLYLAIDFNDSDIVAEGAADGLFHYKLGDICELFIKPADQSWYWEIYATPFSKKSTFFFPSSGRLGLPSGFEGYTCGFKTAAQNYGTVNNWHDKDSHWTAECAMPVKDITARGEKFGPGTRWTVLVARYNYSRYLNTRGAELSSFPQLSKTDFHTLDEYAILNFFR